MFRIPVGQRDEYGPLSGNSMEEKAAGIVSRFRADTAATTSQKAAGRWRLATGPWRFTATTAAAAADATTWHWTPAAPAATKAGHWRPGCGSHRRTGQQQCRAAAHSPSQDHAASAATTASAASARHWRPGPWPHCAGQQQHRAAARFAATTVSYTHLTLPTSYPV